MSSFYPAIYLSLLITFLGISAWFIFRGVRRNRRMESSIKTLEAKLSKKAGTTQENYELGSIYLSKKLSAKAIKHFKKALKVAEAASETNIAPVYNALGYAYFGQEQYDLAIRNYKEALTLDPNYVIALNNLGHAYERKDLKAQALETYEQVLTQDPKNSTAKRRTTQLRKAVTTE